FQRHHERRGWQISLRWNHARHLSDLCVGGHSVGRLVRSGFHEDPGVQRRRDPLQRVRFERTRCAGNPGGTERTVNARGLVLCQILLVMSVVTLGQQEAPPRGSIEGIVAESATNRPLPKASLELRSMDNPDQRYPGLSVDGGVFAIRNVPAGRYALIASRAGYMHAEFGQRGPNGKGLNIILAAGEKRSGIRLVMTQSA